MKYVRLSAIVIIAGLLLIGVIVASDDDDTRTMPEMTQVPEVTEVPEETQPIKVPEETQVSELTAREKAYLDEVFSHWATMNECQKHIAQVDDSNLKATYGVAAGTMRFVKDRVWEMTPPASCKELHNAIEAAVANFSGGLDCMCMYIDTGDDDYYGLAKAYATRTDEWVHEVDRLLDELDR